MTVVDNGVVVDMFLGRLRPEQLGSDDLAAPHLLDSEFLQVLRRHNHRGRLSDGRADGLLTRFEQLVITRYPTAPLRRRIFELRHNLTAYDATYVALAETLDTTLLTTDIRLGNASGPRCPINVL